MRSTSSTKSARPTDRLARDDPRYPELLRDIDGAPDPLYLAGDPGPLNLPQLAIVGSRSATAGGRATARAFAAHLSRHGFCIVSGLALGIDAAAHEGALDSGGATVAVCGTGLDEIYPRQNAGLAKRIVESGGALVSEFPPGTPPRRSQFPQRNRIISGMAVGTLVVEASVQSGALITARFAAEQGREVFAIPGSIHNPVARGCHLLIRSGAKLVETASDIVDELSAALAQLKASTEQNHAPDDALRPAQADENLDEEYQGLLELMGWDPVSINELVRRSGLTPEILSSMLLKLEMNDRVESMASGRYLQREAGREK